MTQDIIIPPDINARLDEIGRTKYINGMNTVIKSYYESSKIKTIIRAVDSMEGQTNFKSLGRKVKIPIELFNDQSHYLEYLFMQMGSELAFGEEIYLSKEIPVRITDHMKVDELNVMTLIDGMAHIQAYERTFSNIVLFMPLKYHNEMYLNWSKNELINLDIIEGSFSFREYPISIIWSNKYNEFITTMILKPDYANWICKPNVDNRLSIRTNLSENQQEIEFIIETKFILEIKNNDLVRVIDIKSLNFP